jgi:hypothetical protein
MLAAGTYRGRLGDTINDMPQRLPYGIGALQSFQRPQQIQQMSALQGITLGSVVVGSGVALGYLACGLGAVVISSLAGGRRKRKRRR